MGVDARPNNRTEARLAYRRSLRRSMIERRLALSVEECSQRSIELCRHLVTSFPELNQLRVAFCWPVRNEPDLRPQLESWLSAEEQGFLALLPVVVEENAPLAFRAWFPECQLTPDRYGIPTPVSGDFIVPEALLLPVNAFDAGGYRLGYGGGYFDRTLAALNSAKRRPLVIGVGFELARVDSIQPEPHDLPMDAIVTEAGVYYRNGGEAVPRRSTD